MRILAIRGKNIASLAGDFAIDFEAPPLAGSGLFAIVGPTGAGKSTLLDVMCLALFDHTPRLNTKGGALVGLEGTDEANRLGAQDVRSLLRKGTASGFAEVDFLGADGGRYRARWSIRRARDRVDGKLGKQNVDLQDLATGAPIGGTKTEVLAAIEERLGLSFDQFRRSALLAQGEFAAFLRAEEKDRASLLEQMTGSEIYTNVSVAAFRRAAEERAKLEAIRVRLADLVVLEPEARDALALEGTRASAEVTVAKGELATLDRARQWYETSTRLRAELATASEQVKTTSAAWDASREERTQLTNVRQARPLGRPVGAADDALRALGEATKALANAEAAEARLAAQRDAEEKAANAATQLVTAARTEADAQRPALEAARRLDAEVAAAVAPLRVAEAALEKSRTATAAARQALRPVAMTTPSVAAHLSPVENASLALVTQALTAVRDLFEAAATASEADLTSAKQALEAADASLAALDVASLRRERQELAARTSDLETLRRRRDERLRLDDAMATAEKEETAARAEAGAAAKEHALARDEAVAANARAVEGQRALDVARAALGLADKRADLREGEACPLCGSAEHPWRDGSAPGSPVVAQLAARVEELRSELAAITKRETTASVRGTEATKRGDDARRRHGERVAEAARAKTEHDALAVRLGHADAAREAVTAAVPEWLAAAGARLADDDARLREREDELEKRATLAREARKECDAGQARVNHDRDAHRKAELAREAATRATEDEAHVVALRGARDELGKKRAALLGGQETIAFEQAQHANLTALATSAEQARARFDGAALEKAGATATREAAARTRVTAETTEATLRAARDGVLGEARLSLDEVRALLGHDEAWEARTAAKIEALRLASHGALKVEEDRTSRLAQHEAKDAPTLDEASVATSRESVSIAATALEKQLADIQLRLRADDEAHARRGERASELTKQEATTHLWASMSDLIGSADGKKFRVFAQRLTFDALLEQANVHLKDISRRYSLQRVPGSDLELQVQDHDMGDDVRAVTSLSGGESFLVSLALALGLSTLGGQRARVESLFVDEGFGTLDPDTLEVAIASLEALHATGCQVGIISHVPGLAERFSACIRIERRGPGRSAVIIEKG